MKYFIIEPAEIVRIAKDIIGEHGPDVKMVAIALCEAREYDPDKPIENWDCSYHSTEIKTWELFLDEARQAIADAQRE